MSITKSSQQVDKLEDKLVQFDICCSVSSPIILSYFERIFFAPFSSRCHEVLLRYPDPCHPPVQQRHRRIARRILYACGAHGAGGASGGNETSNALTCDRNTDLFGGKMHKLT